MLDNELIDVTQYRENLYCIVSEAFQHVCNITILTVNNTTILKLVVLSDIERMIPIMLFLHVFLKVITVA